MVGVAVRGERVTAQKAGMIVSHSEDWRWVWLEWGRSHSRKDLRYQPKDPPELPRPPRAM